MASEQGKQEELLTQLVEKLIQFPFKTLELGSCKTK